MNDILLYGGCDFSVVSKTGAENYALICDKPVLGLNYSELCMLAPFRKSRFFPKKVVKRGSGKCMSWRDYISQPIFFSIGGISFDEENVDYQELDDTEIILAIDEFLTLLRGPDEKWIEYSELQTEYLSMLHPAHLDAYSTNAVPCDVYLRKNNAD